MSDKKLSRYIALSKRDLFACSYDIAKKMRISEAELAHCRVGYDTCRLTPDIPAIFRLLATAGGLTGITENDNAMQEHYGTYANVEFEEHASLLLNPYGLDLRFFLSQWHSAFVLAENTLNGLQHSLQFFDRHGYAVHKIYTTRNTDMTVWKQLTAQFATHDNPRVTPRPVVIPASVPLTPEQQTEFTRNWQQMTDVHQFFTLLKKFNISRLQAFRYVDNTLAQRIDNSALLRLLTLCEKDKNDIMIFVTNRGCVQIFTGAITRLERMISADSGKYYIHIFNELFSFRIAESHIAECWITRKPTKDGIVTSMELFDKNGQAIAQLFGQRTEGEPEQTVWRRQIDTLLSDNIDKAVA